MFDQDCQEDFWNVREPRRRCYARRCHDEKYQEHHNGQFGTELVRENTLGPCEALSSSATALSTQDGASASVSASVGSCWCTKSGLGSASAPPSELSSEAAHAEAKVVEDGEEEEEEEEEEEDDEEELRLVVAEVSGGTSDSTGGRRLSQYWWGRDRNRNHPASPAASPSACVAEPASSILLACSPGGNARGQAISEVNKEGPAGFARVTD